MVSLGMIFKKNNTEGYLFLKMEDRLIKTNMA